MQLGDADALFTPSPVEASRENHGRSMTYEGQGRHTVNA
jgi:hypothetical protein